MMTAARTSISPLQHNPMFALVTALPHRRRHGLCEEAPRSHQMTATPTTTSSSPLRPAHTPLPKANMPTQALRSLVLKVRLDAGPFARIPPSRAMLPLYPTSAGSSGLAVTPPLPQRTLTLPLQPLRLLLHYFAMSTQPSFMMAALLSREWALALYPITITP